MSDKRLEALKLADAALSGANMNMNVVKRKIREALAEQPAQGAHSTFANSENSVETHTGSRQPAQGEAVELAHLRATEVAYENLKASLISAPPAPSVPDDTARLNWLESREASLVTHREAIDEGEFAIWWTVAGEVQKVRADSISGHPLGSVRAAIDAAMLAAAPEVKS